MSLYSKVNVNVISACSAQKHCQFTFDEYIWTHIDNVDIINQEANMTKRDTNQLPFLRL